MKICAIDRSTGKIILSQNGNLSEEQFRNTVKSLNPDVKQENILMVVEGKVDGKISSTTIPSRSLKSVIWKGSFLDAGGYAGMNREITSRLIKHGFSVKTDILNTCMQIDGLTNAYLQAMASTKLINEETCPMVIGFTPMPVQSRKRKHIFFTMMETQALHKSFVDRCNEGAYEVWVPCKFYQNVFKKSGVVKPIKVFPLGVDQSIYTPEARPSDIIYENILTGEKSGLLPENSTKFMSLFGWSYRKGPDILCKSFIREFSAKDNVALVIFSRYLGSPAEQHKQFIRDEILQYYREEGKTNPPPIYYCGDNIPISDMPGCYSQMNAFVFCSRGEGFGMPVIEAGACGLPIISAYDTAMTEYLDEDVAYLVRPAGHAPANEKLSFISGYYQDQLVSFFDESNIIQFGTHMRYVYENMHLAKVKAEKFRKRVLMEYTWDICAKKVADRLTELL